MAPLDIATTTKNDCTKRAPAKQLQCGSRPYSCEPVVSLTRPVSGLLKLVRSMHTIEIANDGNTKRQYSSCRRDLIIMPVMMTTTLDIA